MTDIPILLNNQKAFFRTGQTLDAGFRRTQLDTLLHFANPYLPFGGTGSSGIGSYHGKISFDTFSHHKSILKRRFRLDLPLRYPPFGNKLALLKKVMR